MAVCVNVERAEGGAGAGVDDAGDRAVHRERVGGRRRDERASRRGDGSRVGVHVSVHVIIHVSVHVSVSVHVHGCSGGRVDPARPRPGALLLARELLQQSLGERVLLLGQLRETLRPSDVRRVPRRGAAHALRVIPAERATEPGDLSKPSSASAGDASLQAARELVSVVSVVSVVTRADVNRHGRRTVAAAAAAARALQGLLLHHPLLRLLREEHLVVPPDLLQPRADLRVEVLRGDHVQPGFRVGPRVGHTSTSSRSRVVVVTVVTVVVVDRRDLAP
mmetsp:Transcript_3988/g.17795  ORF Transcript_3988/g.17795 Transcript_3988/m.17795 type:complete len:278 (-) Transcript_3988:76-909(-)